ncbi:hypothetical protein VE03_06372 [Pseudogymnoascus sp. 23342-1-I1]|nr:hypothetical protein VE03_06372 [Pseudogymnoascus sp. 23342-1-I1]
MSAAQQERVDNYEAEHARNKARMAGRHALAAKIRWEAVEKHWLAAKETYDNQSARYKTTTGPDVTTGILATQDWDDNGINGPKPPDRPLSVFSPDPDAIFDTYPAIRRGHWTHGGFPVDDSFGHRPEDFNEPQEHGASHRSADKANHYSEYQPGTIISMMWHQDYPYDGTWKEHDKPCLTLNRQLGVIYSKRRKFIVVARFQKDYIALPIWTSFAKTLKEDRHKNQRSEFMQVIHQGDSIQLANNYRLTPYDFLFQKEKRRQPNTNERQTADGSWNRHMEDEWLDMKANGEALLRLTFPVSFDYRIKCHIIGSLQPPSVEYLLKNWAIEMQRSTLGHLLQMNRTPGINRTREQNEVRQKVDDLTQQLNRHLNIGSEAAPSEVWNIVSPARRSSLEARRAPLARSLEKLASVLEAAEPLVAEATQYGGIYEIVIDTMRVMQETRGFLQLLTRVVAVPNYGGQIPSSPASQNGRSIGVNSPQSPFNSSWEMHRNNTVFSREPGLGEPRFITPGSTLRLTAEQHAQLGHTTQNSDPNWDFPQVEPSQKFVGGSPLKKRKR